MKSLATSVIVIIILAVVTASVLGLMFFKGTSPGAKQITREQAISKCRALCAQDQQRIYSLSGHPGVLDLPNEKYGISYMKSTDFCKTKLNVEGYGEVWCDQLTTCKVTDGDGDTAYLHCTSGIEISGGGGGSVINGPIALAVSNNQKVLSCDKKGEYILLYSNKSNVLVNDLVRVWGIVCNNTKPMANQRVFLTWNDEPLAEIAYEQNFDNITEDNAHNLKVLKGWNLSDTFYVKDSTAHCGGSIQECLEWFWNNIGDSGVITSLGYLSPYHGFMYKHEHGYPTPMTMVNYYNVSGDAKNSDEVDMRFSASDGPRYYYSDGTPYLTLAGTVTEVVFEVTNGTNTKFIHYIGYNAGCHPGKVWNCDLSNTIYDVSQGDCETMMKKAYEKIGIFDINWNKNFTRNNVTFPKNDSNNIFIFKKFTYSKFTRFEFRKDGQLNDNYTLKRVYFLQYSLAIGGCGGSGMSIDDFKILKYKNVTTTNQLGMFNTLIKAPYISGKYKLIATSMNGISGMLNMSINPYIDINFTTKDTGNSINVSGRITYLNGTGINHSSMWVLIDGEPYSEKIDKVTYTFDKPISPNFKTRKTGPALVHEMQEVNGVLLVNSTSWWGGSLTLYYIFDHPQFVNNVTFDIKLLNLSKVDYNYSYYIRVWYEKDFETQGQVGKYLSEKGTNYGRDWWITQNATPENLTLDKWYRITINPLKWIGGTQNGRKRVFIIEFSGVETVHQTGIELDNLTIMSIGKMYTDENGNFEFSIPKSYIGSGTHKITILAYDKTGAEGNLTKTVVVS